MTHHAPPHLPSASEAGLKVAQLRHVLGLVEQIAGRDSGDGAAEAALDESARISIAYEGAMPILQRRFDALAGESTAWAAAGVEALLAADGDPSPAAAARLADELDRALAKLAAVLGA
ncbi:MAG TPA: hypothetical protein VF589_10585 [Allosphingosinicella sp.]|jgi:hypothetical protein